DTAGRPSCVTSTGRRLYGGGGIYPDVETAEVATPPVWLSRLMEDDLPLQWVGGYLSGVTFPTPDSLAASPALPPRALATFRAFAAKKNATIPSGGEADGRLEPVLLRILAYAKWGPTAFYQVAASLDPAVRQAVSYFDRAAALGRK